MAKKNKPAPPPPKGRTGTEPEPRPAAPAPVTAPAPAVRPTAAHPQAASSGHAGGHSPEADGFDDVDDFFFGSETGAFARDELDEDYDPFEPKGNRADARPAGEAGKGAAPPRAAAPGGDKTRLNVPTPSARSGPQPAVRGEPPKAPAARTSSTSPTAPAPGSRPASSPKVPVVAPPEPAPPVVAEEAVPSLGRVVEEPVPPPTATVDPSPPPVPEDAAPPSTHEEEGSEPPPQVTAPQLPAVTLPEDLPSPLAHAPAEAVQSRDGVPISERRAAGAVAAASMSDAADEFAAADDEEEEGPQTDPFGRIPSSRSPVEAEPVARRSALGPGGSTLSAAAAVDGASQVAGPVAAGGDGWAERAAELQAEASASEDSLIRAALLVEAGRVLGPRLGQWSAAEASFEAALGAAPAFLPALRELIRLGASRQEWSRVVDWLARVGAANTDPAGRHAALLASAHLQLSHLDRLPEAAADLRLVLTEAPENYVATRFLREIHYRSQDWPALVELLQGARAHCGASERLRVLYELARLYDEVLKSPAQALATFRACLDEDPRFVPAILACERLLTERSDLPGLAALWRGAAQNWGGADGAFFALRAARVAERSGANDADVGSDLLAAVALDDGSLAAERRAWLESAGRTEDLLELAAGAPAESKLSAHLAVARSALHARGDAALAMDQFQAAFALDGQDAEAQEGLRAQLQGARRWNELIAHLDEVSRGADVRVRIALDLKKAEIAEARLSDIPMARQWLESACAAAPNYLPAVDALVHLLGRQGDHGARAERLELAAGLVDSAEARACYLLRASRDWERAGRRPEALSCLERASGEGPGTLLAREWLVEGLVEDQRWPAAAAVLRQAAAETTDTALRVSLLYRSARMSLQHVGDEDAAEAALRTLLDIVPDFLPATMDLRDILSGRGDWLGSAAFLQAEAEDRPAGAARAGWHRLAAQAYERSGRSADALAQWMAAIAHDPADAASAAAVRRSARASGDLAALSDAYRRQASAGPEGHRGVVLAQLAALLLDARDASALASLCQELLTLPGAPYAALAIATEGLGRFSEATTAYEAALEHSEGEVAASAAFQIGLLGEEVREDSSGAAAAYERALAANPRHPMALEGLERVYASLNRVGDLARLYDTEAAQAESIPVRTFYALLAGEQFEGLSEWDRAVASYERAIVDPVGRERASDALRRIGHLRKDLSAYARCVEALAPTATEPDGLARWMDLSELAVGMGADSLAMTALGHVPGHSAAELAGLLLREALLRQAGDWNGVLATCETMGRFARSEVLRARLERTTREVLETHGVTSDAASDFYRGLHDREPENLVALRGLAGIARSRKDWDEARLYAEEALRLAKEPAVRADLCVELAAVAVEADGDEKASARLLEQALEALPNHRGAVAALKLSHSRSGNWSALVGVLARDASTATGEARTQLFSEIATLWDEKIGNHKVALSSWQKVLQDDPRHAEAADRILALYSRAEDWSGWLDSAEKSLNRLSGADLRDRQAEMGLLALEKLNQPDRASGWLRSAAAHEPPSIPALEALRKLARQRGDWDQVVQWAERQAQHSPETAQRVALLEEGARVKLDQVLDRDGAAALFARVLDLDPQNVPALQFYVGYHFDTENWPAALPVFERFAPTAATMDIDDDDLRIEATAFQYKFGVVLTKAGLATRALTCFERALDLTPTHLPSLEAAAPHWFDIGSWEKARDTYRTILRLRGGAGDANTLNQLYLRLGQAELKVGDVTNAQKRFKKIVDQSPNHVEGMIGLAEIHRLTEDWNSLLSTFNSIIKYARDPDQVIHAYMTKGDVLEQKLQFTDKAVLHYEKVLMYDKSNVDAMTRLGQIALRKGELDRARELGERSLLAARGPEDRALAILLSRLCDAAEPIDVGEVLGQVQRAGDVDGDVLTAWKSAAGDRADLSRADAAAAFRDALRPV